MEDRLKRLDNMFNPKSIAFVGATEMLGKWGFIIFNNILSGGYEGKLYPVNPGRKSILDHKAYPTVRDIPGEVDLAVFTVPAERVMDTIGDCAAKGVKAGVVISAGFKEMGGRYADMEAELVKKARAAGMVLAGPNGQGICCPDSKLYAWMPNFYPPPGRVSVVSQSGNIQNMLIGGVVEPGFGVAKSVSSGNEADLKMEDYFEYLASDPETDAIASYIEGVPDGRRFIEGAKAASKKKPIIVLKGGKTDSGISAARSHTGAMAVSDEIFDAACRQAGIIRARNIEDAGIIAASFLNRPLPKGRRVGILTGGGGLGVVAADVCSEEGLIVPPLSKKTLEAIGKMMPNWWVPGNPVDMVAGLNFQSVMPIMKILMESGEVDSLIVLFVGPPRIKRVTSPVGGKGMDMRKIWESMTKHFHSFANVLVDLMHQINVPLFMVSNFQPEMDEAPPEIREKNMVVHKTIQSACRSVAAMATYREFKVS